MKQPDEGGSKIIKIRWYIFSHVNPEQERRLKRRNTLKISIRHQIENILELNAPLPNWGKHHPYPTLPPPPPPPPPPHKVRKIAFTIKNEIGTEGLSSPKSIGIFIALKCISGPNLVILARTGDKLSCRQAQNGMLTLKLYLTLKVTIDHPHNNRDLNHTKMHFWSKFGDFSLNEWQVIVRTSSKWGKIRLSS